MSGNGWEKGKDWLENFEGYFKFPSLEWLDGNLVPSNLSYPKKDESKIISNNGFLLVLAKVVCFNHLNNYLILCNYEI